MKSNNKPLTLSIVIPAYNEESHIKKCLDSINNQTLMPNEVILVDNNCTDNTVAIAKKYKFVRVVKESSQGQGFARTKGLNSATTDIIGRIDADSVLNTNWTQVVIETFQDKKIDAITGPGYTQALPKLFGIQLLPNYYSGLWSRVYLVGATGIMRIQALWGANMAIRTSAWKTVVDEACNDDKKVHEDQDLAILLSSNGLASNYVDRLRISMDGDSFFYWPKYWEYMNRSFRTYGYRIELGFLDRQNVVRKPIYYFPIAILIIIFPTIIFTIASFLVFYSVKLFKMTAKGR